VTITAETLERAGLCKPCDVIYRWVGLPLVRDAYCPRCLGTFGRATVRSPQATVFELPFTAKDVRRARKGLRGAQPAKAVRCG
jgi:uncharacterized paraquat-inducible protein A